MLSINLKFLLIQLLLTNLYNLVSEIYQHDLFRIILSSTSLGLIFLLFAVSQICSPRAWMQIVVYPICAINLELVILLSPFGVTHYLFGFLLMIVGNLKTTNALAKVLSHFFFMYMGIRVLFQDTSHYPLIVLVILLQPCCHLILMANNRPQSFKATQTFNAFTLRTNDDYQEIPCTSREQLKTHIIQEDFEKRLIVKKQPDQKAQYSMLEFTEGKGQDFSPIFCCLPFGLLVLGKDMAILDYNTKLESYLGIDDESDILEILDHYIKTADIYEFKQSSKPSRKTQRNAHHQSSIRLDRSQSVRALPPDKHLSTLSQIMNQIPASAQSLNVDSGLKQYILRIKDQQGNIIRCLKMRIFRVDNYQGHNNAHILVFENITKKEESKMLSSKFKFQQNLLNSLCHELRTPMNATLCQLTALSEKLPINLNTQYLRPAFNSAQKLNFQLNDIMDYAQILCDNFKLTITNFRARDIKDQITQLFEQDCMQKQISLIISGFWESNIQNDKERILRILINLIDNSIKFTQQGGRIEVSYQASENDVSFSILDNGLGMDPDTLATVKSYQKTIYEDFYVQDKKTKLGLGLRLCQYIAKFLCIGQQLNIESELGRFTKIWFSFHNKGEQIEALSSFRLPMDRKECNCIKMLIVDDIGCNHYALQLLLKKYSLLADSAYTGIQAIEKVRQRLENPCCRTYQLIFMDIEMPGKSGFSTTQEIVILLKAKQLSEASVIVMYSAYSGEEDIKLAKFSGMKEVAKKPLEPAVLENLLFKYIF